MFPTSKRLRKYLCDFLNIAWKIFYFVSMPIVFLMIGLAFILGKWEMISDLQAVPSKINFHEIPEQDFWKVIFVILLIPLTFITVIYMSVA